MKHKYFFQWNIPADNQFSERTDRYIDVVATWNDDAFYTDGRPMVFVKPFDFDFGDAMQVKDWYKAKCDIDQIAQNHFAEIAKAERLAKARAELIAAGEPTGIPTLDRYTEAEKDLIIQEQLS